MNLNQQKYHILHSVKILNNFNTPKITKQYNLIPPKLIKPNSIFHILNITYYLLHLRLTSSCQKLYLSDQYYSCTNSSVYHNAKYLDILTLVSYSLHGAICLSVSREDTNNTTLSGRSALRNRTKVAPTTATSSGQAPTRLLIIDFDSDLWVKRGK